MSYLVSINRSHIVQNGLNNQFSYPLPTSSANLNDMELCIKKISLYNSVFNIDAQRFNNNVFQISMPTGNTTSLITITLQDGYYEYRDINRMIQRALISAGAYLIDESGGNVFFVALSSNSVYYSAQFDLTPVPTTLGTHTRPATGLYSSTGSGLPNTTLTPRLVINNEAFGQVVGLTTGSWPVVSTGAANSVLSNIPPQISPISAYSLRCSLVDNPFSIPSDLLCTFDTQGTTSGQLISYEPNEYLWLSVASGNSPSINLTITDQVGRFVKFNDPNILIEIIFKQSQKN